LAELASLDEPELQSKASDRGNQQDVAHRRDETEIARWLINGARDWLENGLVRPSVVLEAKESSEVH
jgi:hypothetical protein